MATQVGFEVGQGAAAVLVVHKSLHVPPTHDEPGRQSSGAVEHVSPTFLLCMVAQSQTVLESLTVPVSPARKTQLKLALLTRQSAVPVGLQARMGGEHSQTLWSGAPLLLSIVLFVHRESLAQSTSLRQVL
jgi:hypothetical protein